MASSLMWPDGGHIFGKGVARGEWEEVDWGQTLKDKIPQPVVEPSEWAKCSALQLISKAVLMTWDNDCVKMLKEKKHESTLYTQHSHTMLKGINRLGGNVKMLTVVIFRWWDVSVSGLYRFTHFLKDIDHSWGGEGRCHLRRRLARSGTQGRSGAAEWEGTWGNWFYIVCKWH